MEIVRTQAEIDEAVANIEKRQYPCSGRDALVHREQVLMVGELKDPGSVDVNSLKDDMDVCAVLCVRDWLEGRRDERPDEGYGASDDH